MSKGGSIAGIALAITLKEDGEADHKDPMNIHGEVGHMIPWLKHSSLLMLGEAHVPCRLKTCREEKCGGMEMQRCGGADVWK